MTALGNAPAHWRRTTIGDIAEVRLGRQRSPKNHTGEFMQPYLRAANVNWYSLRPADIQQMNFTNDEMGTYALRRDDILIVEGSGSATEVGKCALVPERYAGHAFQNTLIRVRPNETVDPRWLMYRINADAELGGFLKLARGSGIFHLGSTRTSTWPIALPPLEEQHANVEAIERLLSRLDAGVGDLAHVNRLVATARRSLTESAIRDATSAPIHLLGELATTVRNGGHWKAPSHAPPGEPILRISAVRPGELRQDQIAYVTTEVTPDEWSRFSVKAGSLLFTRYNGNPQLVGACARVPPSAAGMLHPDKLIRVDLGPRVLPEWVEIAAAGGVTRTHLDAHVKTTSGQAGIAGRDVKTAPVPVPSLDDQQRLVERVKAGRDRLRRLVAATDLTNDRSHALRRSILKAAFEGRLTHNAAGTPVQDFEQVPA